MCGAKQWVKMTEMADGYGIGSGCSYRGSITMSGSTAEECQHEALSHACSAGMYALQLLYDIECIVPEISLDYLYNLYLPDIYQKPLLHLSY